MVYELVGRWRNAAATLRDEAETGEEIEGAYALAELLDVCACDLEAALHDERHDGTPHPGCILCLAGQVQGGGHRQKL